MRAASLWDGMAELSDSQIWTALAGANGTADRKPLWGDSVELGQGTTLRTGGCCSSALWSQAECCTDGCCRKCDRWSSVSFYEAIFAAQPDDEVNMLKTQWQHGGGLHFNAAMGAEFIPGARNALSYEKPETHHVADLTCGVAHGSGDADVCSGCEFTVTSPTQDAPSMHRHGVRLVGPGFHVVMLEARPRFSSYTATARHRNSSTL